MTSVTAAPWRQLDGETAVEGSRWRILRDGDDPELGESLDDWDPGLDLNVIRDVKIDVDTLRAETGMPANARLVVGASWHSEGSTLRGAGNRVTLPSAGSHRCTLRINAKGLDLSGNIVLATTIVLAELLTRAPVRARLPGSILYEDSAKLMLEGGASRFPMEPVAFASSGYQLPSEAAWALDWDPDELELPVLGSVRLLLNTDHEAVSTALMRPQGPGPSALFAAMQLDIGRQMIMAALSNDEFITREDWPKGSVGKVLRRLLTSRFPHESPRALKEKWRQEPQRFEAMIQSALLAFHEIGPQ